MLMRFARWVVDAVFSNSLDESQREICIYGAELMFYTWLSTLALLAIGCLCGHPVESAIIILSFYVLQSNGGGYHASSHIRCFLLMTAGLLTGMAMLRLSKETLAVFAVISAGVLLLTPLQLHPNKRYLAKHSNQLKSHSHLATLSVCIFVLAFALLKHEALYKAGCAALLLSAISRLAARKNG